MNGPFMAMLEKLRVALGRPLVIRSGFRCESKNMSLKKAAKNSLHLRGRAVDIRVRSSFERFMLIKHAMQLGFAGIGVNRTTVHLDNRPQSDAAMWHYY